MKYDIEQILREYETRNTHAKFLTDEVKYIIYKSTNREQIKIHHIFNRVKGFDSFLNKIKVKRLKDPFNEIHDLFGFRIICLFLEDINKIGDLINREFNVFDVENKIDEVGCDVFGYMASHYKARLKSSEITNAAKEYSFEIQIRTIAQDAWASISHHLFCKHESFLTDNLKRDFHALSGLFYIADTHFSFLRDEQAKYFISELQKVDDDTKVD